MKTIDSVFIIDSTGASETLSVFGFGLRVVAKIAVCGCGVAITTKKASQYQQKMKKFYLANYTFSITISRISVKWIKIWKVVKQTKHIIENLLMCITGSSELMFFVLILLNNSYFQNCETNFHSKKQWSIFKRILQR